MNHRAGPTSSETRRQEAAFQHPDVATIAREVVASRDPVFLRLAKMAIIYPWPGVDTFVPIPKGEETRATAIAEAGFRIATEQDEEARDRKRGALVERVVWELVRARDPGVQRERSIELSRNRWSREQWSKPKEILALRSSECEVYECKLTPGALDQDDVNELADIRDTALSEGLTAFSTVATLEAYTTLRSALLRCRTHGDLHFVTGSEVFDLASAPPVRTMRA